MHAVVVLVVVAVVLDVVVVVAAVNLRGIDFAVEIETNHKAVDSFVLDVPHNLDSVDNIDRFRLMH